MTLGAWAARTTRVPLGVMVCGVGYRNVGLTVKMATALDHASDGRAMLGPRRRLARARAPGVRLRDARPRRSDQPLRRGEPAGPGHARRRRRTARTAAGSAPTRSATIRRPSRPRMPLLIGGSGEQRTLRIVARDADIWNGEGDPATFAHKSAVLDAHCAEIGRDPSSIRRTVGVQPVCIRGTRGGGGRGAGRDPDRATASTRRRPGPGRPARRWPIPRRPSSACSVPGARPGPRRPSSTCRARSTTRRSSGWPAPVRERLAS